MLGWMTNSTAFRGDEKPLMRENCFQFSLEMPGLKHSFFLKPRNLTPIKSKFLEALKLSRSTMLVP